MSHVSNSKESTRAGVIVMADQPPGNQSLEGVAAAAGAGASGLQIPPATADVTLVAVTVGIDQRGDGHQRHVGRCRRDLESRCPGPRRCGESFQTLVARRLIRQA